MEKNNLTSHAMQIMRRIEAGEATNWPKLAELGRDPVIELIHKLLWDEVALRKLKDRALHACTVRRKGGQLVLEAVDSSLNCLLDEIEEREVQIAAIEAAVRELDSIFAAQACEEPVLASLQRREKALRDVIDRAGAEVSLAARRIMHRNRLPLSPEEVLSDPRYTEIRAEMTAKIDAAQAELEPILAAREKVEATIAQFGKLPELDLTGSHYLIPQEGMA